MITAIIIPIIAGLIPVLPGAEPIAGFIG